MTQFDLIIIGAGPGGYETALEAAAAGKHVALIEERAAGGTCLHEGCIPTKCLAHSAEVLESVKTAAAFGISCGEASFALPTAVQRKDEVVARLTAGIDAMLKSAGVERYAGHAMLTADHTVSVGDDTLTAPHIIIATGSEARRLPIPGADLPQVITSTEMLNLQEVPRRLCIIGGGVIGMEFAGIFATLGSTVTVVEYCKEILPPFDKDMAKRLRMILKKKGIDFRLESAVERIEAGDGATAVHFSTKGKAAAVEADLVLMAVGRAPRVAGLGLEQTAIEHSARGIVTDENMQTTVPGVYAIGDVNNRCPLAHAATFQGRRALHHILGREDGIDFALVPSVVYTQPNLAQVGLREEDFADGKPTAVKAFYRANGRALTMGAEEGMVKLLFDADDRLRGAHILGEGAAEMIHEAAVLIAEGATRSRLHDIIHAHPTLSEMYLA